jgi:hypothetical protein
MGMLECFDNDTICLDIFDRGTMPADYISVFVHSSIKPRAKIRFPLNHAIPC